MFPERRRSSSRRSHSYSTIWAGFTEYGSSISIDGKRRATGSLQGGQNPTFIELGGGLTYPGNNARSHFAEFAFFSTVLNGAQQRIYDNYAGARYNLPLADKKLDLYAGDDAEQGNRDFGVFGIGKADNGALENTGADGQH